MGVGLFRPVSSITELFAGLASDDDVASCAGSDVAAVVVVPAVVGLCSFDDVRTATL